MKLLPFLIASMIAVPSFAQAQREVPVVGQAFKFDFGKFAFQLRFENDTTLTIAFLNGSTPGPAQAVTISKTEIRPNVYLVTWQEKSGTTVTDIQDFGKGVVYANITEPGNKFEHWKGKIVPIVGRVSN